MYISKFRFRPIGNTELYARAIEELHRIEDKVHHSRLGSLTSTERLKLIDIAIILFGRSINTYLDIQSGMIDDRNEKAIEFLIDTIGFIDCGFRGMSLDYWMTSIYHPTTRASYSELPVRNTFAGSAEVPKLTFNYIDDWVSKPNGFSDLTSTLFILFGRNAVTPRRMN